MARAIALVQTTVLPGTIELLRSAIVCACGLALILAGHPLPI